MLPIHSIHHIALKTNQVERLVSFYQTVLGLTQVRIQKFPDGSVRSIWLKVGATLIMIEKSEAGELQSTSASHSFSEDAPGIHLIALAIDESDRMSWISHLKEHGVVVEKETEHSVYFFDPDGNRVCLSHFSEPQH